MKSISGKWPIICSCGCTPADAQVAQSPQSTREVLVEAIRRICETLPVAITCNQTQSVYAVAR